MNEIKGAWNMKFDSFKIETITQLKLIPVPIVFNFDCIVVWVKLGYTKFT